MSLGAENDSSHRDVCAVHRYAISELDRKASARDQIIIDQKRTVDHIKGLIVGDGKELGIAAKVDNNTREIHDLHYKVDGLRDSFDRGKNWIIGLLIGGFSAVCGTLGTGLWMILSKKLVIAGLN